MPDRCAGLQVIGGIAGGRVPAVHAQRDTAHARQREGLAIRADPVGMPVGERRPDLPGEHLTDQLGCVTADFHQVPWIRPPSGKSTQALVRNDASNALMVSCTSAPWAKSPWLASLPLRISVVKSDTRLE